MSGLNKSDLAMAISVPFIWAMGILFAKSAIEHFPPILLMAFRFFVASLILAWLVKPPIGQLGKIFAIAIVSAAIQYSLTFTGLKYLDASTASLIVQLEVPFLVILGALFLNERPGWVKWTGIGLAFGGVALISNGVRLEGNLSYAFLVALGGLAWAVGQIMVRQLRDIDGLTVTAWVAVFAAPQLTVMSLIFEDAHLAAIQSAGPKVWLAVLYLGVVMTAIGYWFWYSLIRRHPVQLVGPFLLLLPVFAVIGGAVFLGEPLTANKLLGGLVVIAGVGLVVVEKARVPSKV